MLGQAREKFASIAGPQGGTALNGASLKAEGQADIDRLTDELKTNVSGGIGYSWIIG
jgi:GTPase involved in cell partitioning and DNA repair